MTFAPSPDVERAVIAKVSWRLLPLIALGYGVAYMDRVNISFAAATMNRDLKFSAAVYGLGAGLFFLSYALFEVPSNLLLVRFGARRWIARIMLTWGVLAVSMMFVKTPLQFYVVRFLLGLAEAGFFPGVIYYLTHWFPEAHRGRAISRFYVAYPVSTIFMGAVAGALLGLQGRLGLSGWQWLFLAEGSPAIILSIAILFLLPDAPATSTWLTDDEKRWLARRLGAEKAALGEPVASIFAAMLKPPVLAFAAANFLILGTNYAFSLSAPQLLGAATHLSAGRVGYIVAAGGFIGALTMLLNGWLSDRAGEHYFHLAAPLLLIALAFAAMSQTMSPLIVVGAYFLVIAGSTAQSPVFWLAPGSFLHPRDAAVGVAAINMIGQLGSFMLPWLWGIAKDRTGDYHAGLTALPLAYLFAAAIVLAIRPRVAPKPFPAE